MQPRRAQKGVKNTRVLNYEQAREVCSRAWRGETQRDIAQEYGISDSLVSRIKYGKAYSGVTVNIRKDYQSDPTVGYLVQMGLETWRR